MKQGEKRAATPSNCPFCGSSTTPIINRTDSRTGKPQYGCPDCDRWWDAGEEEQQTWQP